MFHPRKSILPIPAVTVEEDTTAKVQKQLSISSPKEEKRTSDPIYAVPYVVVYIFLGKLKRAGIGHAAFWDTENYHSFYGTDEEKGDKKWISQAKPSPKFYPEAAADDLAKYDSKVYGDFLKVIIPLDKMIKRAEAEKDIREEWKTTGYKLLAKDCVHQVEAHLIKLGILEKPHGELLFLLPSDLYSDYTKLGLERFNELIKKERAEKPSKEQIENRRDFLLIFHSAIMGINAKKLPTTVEKTLKPFFVGKDIKALSAEEISKLYFQIKEFLGNKHYIASINQRHESKAFYAQWYAISLIPDPKVIKQFEDVLPAERRPSILEQKGIAVKLPKKSDPKITENRCKKAIKSIYTLVYGLHEHYKIAEKNGSHLNDFKPIFDALSAKGESQKDILANVFKQLLSVLINRIFGLELEEKERGEILNGTAVLEKFYQIEAIKTFIKDINPTYIRKKRSIFNRGIIEIMDRVSQLYGELNLHTEPNLKNQIQSMRVFTNIAVSSGLTLPLQHLISTTEMTKKISKALADNDSLCRNVYINYTSAMAIARPKSEEERLRFVAQAIQDRIDPKIVAKIIVADLIDRKSEVFGNGKQAKKLYEDIINKFQHPDALIAENSNPIAQDEKKASATATKP